MHNRTPFMAKVERLLASLNGRWKCPLLGVMPPLTLTASFRGGGVDSCRPFSDIRRYHDRQASLYLTGGSAWKFTSRKRLTVSASS